MLTPLSLEEVRFPEHLISIEQMKQAHQEIMSHAASISSHRENDYYFHGNYIHENGLYINFSTDTFQVLSVDKKQREILNYIPSGNDYQPIWEMNIFAPHKQKIKELLESLKI